MCLGGLLALDLREETALSSLLRKALLPLSAILAVWMWHGLSFTTSIGSVLGLQLIAVTSAALIAAALKPSTWIARILGSKFFALGGKKFAFAMYVFHPLMLEICMSLPSGSKGLRLILFGISTVVIAGLSYRYVESYFLHIRVGGAISPPRDSAAVLTSTQSKAAA
jgi:peptidoglycan/LPS O-acetylase OafA/YrhL